MTYDRCPECGGRKVSSAKLCRKCVRRVSTQNLLKGYPPHEDRIRNHRKRVIEEEPLDQTPDDYYGELPPIEVVHLGKRYPAWIEGDQGERVNELYPTDVGLDPADVVVCLSSVVPKNIEIVIRPKRKTEGIWMIQLLRQIGYKNTTLKLKRQKCA